MLRFRWHGARKKRLGGDGGARKCFRRHATQHPFRGALRLEGDGVREAAITDPSDFLKILNAMTEMVQTGELS